MTASSQAFQNLIVTVAAGDRIFTEGEIGTTMFIVQSGRVLLFREPGGGKVAISEMEKGDFFGEMSLLEGTPRNMSAEALDACELIEINSTTFDRMIRSNVEIAVRLLRKLSGRLQKAEALIITQRSALESAQQAAARPAAPAASAQAAPLAAHPAPTAGPSRAHAAAGAMSGASAQAKAHAAGAVMSPPQARAAAPVAEPTAPAGMPARPAKGASPAAAPAQGGSLSATRPPTPSMQAAARSAAAPGQARAAAAPRPGPQSPRLVSESGDTVYPLAAGESLIGRYDPVTETQPEVDLTLLDIKRSVSRRHARITMQDGVFHLVEEVGALNGTFINGSKLVTGRPAPLRDSDRVSVGTVNLVFHA